MRYRNQFIALVKDRITGRKTRTYGFEYELIGEDPLSPEDFSNVKSCLPSLASRNGKTG